MDMHFLFFYNIGKYKKEGKIYGTVRCKKC